MPMVPSSMDARMFRCEPTSVRTALRPSTARSASACPWVTISTPSGVYPIAPFGLVLETANVSTRLSISPSSRVLPSVTFNSINGIGFGARDLPKIPRCRGLRGVCAARC